MSPRLLRYGERGWLAELADGVARRAWHAALSVAVRASEAHGAPHLRGVVDVVPAARTVLVVFDSEVTARAAEPQLRALTASQSRSTKPQGPAGDPIEIPMRYDGADLAEVAQRLGIRTADVVARHQEQVWFVDFMGFLPGFAYLLPDGPDRPLRVPRRDRPRTAVSPGSVGLADAFTGVYPQASPGGWQLIGRTDLRLWDQNRIPPSLLSPGTRVRFLAAAAGREEPAETSVPKRSAGEIAFTVLATGAQLLVEDLGRPGQAHLAVSGGGASDRGALRRGNRLLGNPERAAGLEILLGGARLRSEKDQWVCVTGAPGPVLLDSRAVAHDEPVRLRAGEKLWIGPTTLGLRRYLCRRGGLGGPAVLGSLSTDPVSGLGPPPLRVGDTVVAADLEPAGEVTDGMPLHTTAGYRPLALYPGPRTDWVLDGLDALVASPWSVTSELNRVGVRLNGPRLALARHDELPSEGVLRGAVQVPPNGQPMIFGPDHPVTGGYPVIACVAEADLDRLSQLRPGDVVSFRRARELG